MKYAYYCKKPRGAITKDILRAFLVSGILIVGGGPYLGTALWKSIGKEKKRPKRRFANAFSRLRRQGLLSIEQQGHDVCITLTPEGKKAAGYMQINDLAISKQKKWDGVWRVVVFDVSNLKTLQRNAFRGKLKELGFMPLQKSVWVQPFPCKAEIDILRDFYDLTEREVRLMEVRRIDGDAQLKKYFSLM